MIDSYDLSDLGFAGTIREYIAYEITNDVSESISAYDYSALPVY